MSLISTIKSILGLGGGDRSERETTVTVERDSDVPAETESTRAAPSSAPSVTETDAESGPDVEERAVEEEDPVEAEDPVEEEDPVADEAPVEAEVDDAGDEAASDDDGEPVDTISGIGPAYAERLANAGVETVDDLAAADAADLADATDISETRIAGWIESAQAN